jgi:hypothetical protein
VNKFVLKHHHVEVDYTLIVAPTLVYQDSSSTPKSFTASEIMTNQTGLGTLAFVSLVLSIGAGGERFGSPPSARPPAGQSAEFRTAGVYERFSGPDSLLRDPSWRCIELDGRPFSRLEQNVTKAVCCSRRVG